MEHSPFLNEVNGNAWALAPTNDGSFRQLFTIWLEYYVLQLIAKIINEQQNHVQILIITVPCFLQ